MSDFYNHKDDWYRIELNLNEHKDDTIKHITDAERQNWNAKSDAHDHPYAPSSHVGDSTHLAEGERQTWNAKSDAHDHPYAPLSHVGDNTHVTGTEKSTWNGKATSADITSAINTHISNMSHGYMVPDYDNITVITGPNNIATYTAEVPGIIYVTNNMNTTSHACDVYIRSTPGGDDILIAQFQEYDASVALHTFQLASGNKITFDCSRMGAITFLSQLTDPGEVSDISSDSLFVIFVPYKTIR